MTAGDDRLDPTPALAAVEAEEGVVVLLAVESGSRAWGFPSPDSDWDVRFVYARPTIDFLRLHPPRDVIERPDLPDALDLSGWDMRKTLALMLGGNAVIREWLRSPIVYRAEPEFVAALRHLAERVPARASLRHHYRSLAIRVSKQWLGRPEVPLKKYLYAVRPALALRWLRAHPAGSPPMDVAGLLAEVRLSPEESAALSRLLAAKRLASELGTGAAIPALDRMIGEELAASEEEPRLPPPGPDLVAEAEALLARSAQFADRHVAPRGAPAVPRPADAAG